MKYLDLRKKLTLNLFSLLDVLKIFPEEKEDLIKIQLSRFAKKNLLMQIKRGLYCFESSEIDEFELANKLYQPSYISLETALNYYGMIPDIPQSLTSVTLTTTKTIKNQFGIFTYTKISAKLFFGFKTIKSAKSQAYFNIAGKEKSLLDFLYVRRVASLEEMRLNWEEIDLNVYKELVRHFPAWVGKIKIA